METRKLKPILGSRILPGTLLMKGGCWPLINRIQTMRTLIKTTLTTKSGKMQKPLRRTKFTLRIRRLSSFSKGITSTKIISQVQVKQNQPQGEIQMEMKLKLREASAANFSIQRVLIMVL
jgi:hypothetical protein